VTLAELTSADDVGRALAFLRGSVCSTDFQAWDGS
jgi:hypothetical protein